MHQVAVLGMIAFRIDISDVDQGPAAFDVYDEGGRIVHLVGGHEPVVPQHLGMHRVLEVVVDRTAYSPACHTVGNTAVEQVRGKAGQWLRFTGEGFRFG